jgi:hypothetical protein
MVYAVLESMKLDQAIQSCLWFIDVIPHSTVLTAALCWCTRSCSRLALLYPYCLALY